MKPTKTKLDYRKRVENSIEICLKAFRSFHDQETCRYAEKHPDRDFCKWYNFDGTCELQDNDVI